MMEKLAKLLLSLIVLLGGLAGAIMIMGVFTKASQKTNDAKLEADLVDAANWMSAQLPKRVDEQTIAQSAVAAGKTVMLSFRVEMPSEAIDVAIFRDSLTKTVHHNYCNMPETRKLLNVGGRMKNSYFDENGRYLLEIVTTSDDCR